MRTSGFNALVIENDGSKRLNGSRPGAEGPDRPAYLRQRSRLRSREAVSAAQKKCLPDTGRSEVCLKLKDGHWCSMVISRAIHERGQPIPHCLDRDYA